MNAYSYFKIIWVAISGGPCGGKSTTIEKAKKELEKLGFFVIVISELATMLHAWGIDIHTLSKRPETQLLLQTAILEGQRTHEAILEPLIRTCMELMNVRQAIVLCDRGSADGEAYSSQKSFGWLLEERNLSLPKLHKRYDGVVLLETAASNAEEFYSLESNDARDENLELARSLDKSTQDAWTGHEYLKIIPNIINGKRISFDEKMERSIEAIFSIIGHPDPVENEIRFKVLSPIPLEQWPVRRKVSYLVKQMYLNRLEANTDRRIRMMTPQTFAGEAVSYYYTEKKKIPGTQARYEKQFPISALDFASLSSEMDAGSVPLHKERILFTHDSCYWQFDEILEPVHSLYLLEHEFYNLKDKEIVPPVFLGECINVTDTLTNRQIAFGKY